ncbi:MAG TPA: M14 family metallopeptidase, partial [Oceanipulchritudo sp.]|nr:M14 family metallopeptidase [Oceanipulchritudo sp.]
MKKAHLLPLLLIGISGFLQAGTSGFLPTDIDYDPAITTPAQYFGFEIGSRHLTHAELVAYLRHLDQQSDRIEIIEYGRTHGHRPLMQLLISTPENLSQKQQIRSAHKDLLDPSKALRLDLGKMPMVVNINYSVHGNEPSGANAAPVIAWYLAAAQGEKIESLLANTIILLDPTLNPDGLDRFANWTNSTTGRNPNPDPNTREHQEGWPNGRTNYYYFDLNRDWMLLTQPESRGRMALYHQWLPNFVLDFHEMGTDATYFFQPGIPERTHPLIPESVTELTERISHYFANALDTTGSLYFTKERFDDFYMGKGSTISDLKGAIGLLFEQASSRGMIQDSINGPVTFAFTIQNQVTVSLAVLEAAADLRIDFLEHMQTFFSESLKLAEKADLAGYRFAAPEDPARATELAWVLRGHDIVVEELMDGSGWFIPLQQPHYRYLQALVERRTEFKETSFYDITTWTLPLAYNLEWEELRKAPKTAGSEPSRQSLSVSRLGYLVDWATLNAPRAVLDLLQQDVIVKVAKAPFSLNGQAFGYGTVFVPVSIQADKADTIHTILSMAASEKAVRIAPVSTFLTEQGIDLGSSDMAPVNRPRIVLVGGEGLNSAEMGEVWHLLDVQCDYPVTIVQPSALNGLDLPKYTALILPGGRASAYPDSLVEKLKTWTREGGTLVCLGSASKWAIDKGLVSLKMVQSDPENPDTAPARRPFSEAANDAALQRIRGAIFETEIDVSHPLAYGYTRDHLPVFVEGETFLAPSQNRYQTPLIFSPEPLLSGYASQENLIKMAGTAAAAVESQGAGVVI